MDGMVVFDERDYSCDREDNVCRVTNLKIYIGKKKLNYCLSKAQYSSKNFTRFDLYLEKNVLNISLITQPNELFSIRSFVLILMTSI
jgi:hypothetical protein